MKYNLAQLDEQQKSQINTELSAAGVAFKERYAMPVNADLVEEQIAENERAWFRQRLKDYRQLSLQLPRLPWEPKN